MARRFTRTRDHSLGRAFRAPVAFAGTENAHPLNPNPNRGKHNAAKMTDAFLVELAECESRAYSPLTVSHPTLDSLGRRNSRSRTSYTV